MNLKKELDKRGITKYRFAKDLGISHPTASNWINNPMQIKLDRLYDIAEYLKIDVKDLIG
jgi:transcriptional regulator with XRE-family HTH domain